MGGGIDNLTPEGAYIYVKREKDLITIRQDFVGCYGLYLFREGEYWALSNSFLYLEEKIRDAHHMTFNKEYADYFLISGLSSLSCTETFVKEISCLDRAAIVTIDTFSSKLSYEIYDFKENTIEVDSEEGIKILDRWHEKWISVIYNLKQRTNNITVDLSGGFDSRLTFSLFTRSGIDMTKVCVHSTNDNLYTHSEDYEIASKIAEYYQFRLNDKQHFTNESVNFSEEDIINLSMYTKLGFHTQMYWKKEKSKQYNYLFTGSSGEILRDLSTSAIRWKDLESFVGNQEMRSKTYGNNILQSTRKVLNRSFSEISSKYKRYGRNITSEDLGRVYYMDTISRYHFGKALVESYLAGIITFCPLLDSDLHRLKQNSLKCQDRNLLITTIFDRYSDELLKFKFQGGRSISQSTIDYVKAFNSRNPYRKTYILTEKKDNCSVKENVINDSYNDNIKIINPKISYESLQCLMKDAFYSSEVRNTFEVVYSTKKYYKLAERWIRNNFYPEANAYVVLPIVKIFNDCKQGIWYRDQKHIAEQILHWAKATEESNRIEENLLSNPYMSNYIISRLDIRTQGNDNNDLTITEISDGEASISSPEWICKGGKGYVIQSDRGHIHLRLRCEGDGNFRLTLRGVDVRDKNRNRIPFWIDYTALEVNGRNEITEDICIWHDQPYHYNKAVIDGEELDITVKWRYHDARICVPKIKREIAEKNDSDRQKKEAQYITRINELTAENKKLKSKLENISNSRSYKLGKAIAYIPNKLRSK